MASTNFINECKNGANSNRLGKIVINGVAEEINQSNKLASFSVDSGCYADGTIIGTVYIKCLNGNLVNIDSISNLIDKELTASVGVKFANSSTEYVNLGKYTISRPNDEQTLKECQIKAYDNIYNKINEKYVSNLDYTTPKTVSNLYQDLCTNLGLTPVTTTFLNSTIPVSNNPFTNGETNLIVLQSIAKVACSFVTIDETTDHIDLSWLSTNANPDYTFQLSDYSTLEGGTIQYGPANVIVIKNSQVDDENVTRRDETSISQYGEHQVVISEDYILYNATLRQQAMTAIYNRLDGLKYIDSKLTCLYGKPFLKIGNKIRIYKDSTNYIDTYVLKHNFTYDGAFTSVIESPVMTEQEVRTQQKTSLGKALRNTEIKVDKQNGEINLLVSRTNEIENNIDPTNHLTSSNNTYHFEDAAESNLVNFEIDGKSTQETTTGKNKLPNNMNSRTYNGVTITKNSDGTYTLNGTATAEVSLAINTDFIPLSGTWRMLGCPSGGSASTYMLSAYVGYWGTASPNIDTGNGTNITYTGDVKVRFYIKNGTTCNNLVFKPMLTTDTSATINDFEPYTNGPSPNPDYPQEIESVGYENLFDYRYSNLKNINRCTTSEETNGFKLTSTGVSGYGFASLEIDNSLLGKTITISMNSSGNKTPSARLFYHNASGALTSNEGAFWTTESPHIVNMPSSLPSGSTGMAIVFYISQGNNNSGDYAIFKDIQIEKGTQPHSYIPYGKYGIEYKTKGKNLLPNNISSQTINGLTIIKNNDGSLLINGTATSGTRLYFIESKDITPNTYTMSISKEGSISGNSYISFQNGNTEVFSMNIRTLNSSQYVLTTNINLKMSLYLSNGTTFTNFKIYPMLEKNSTATSYEPYQEKTTLIQFDEPLRSVGNVKDKLRIENNTLYVDRYIGRVVLNGSENVTMYGSSGERRYYILNTYFPNIDTNQSKEIKCTNFVWTAYISGAFALNKFGYHSGANAMVFDTDFGESANDFKTWLSTHPTEVIYELATPTTEVVGEMKLPTLLNTNNIDIYSNIITDSSLTYTRNVDLANYINNQIVSSEASIKVTTDSIQSQVSSNADGIRSATTTLTDQGLAIDVLHTNIDSSGNVTAVTTTSGFTFNENGMSIDDNSTSFKARYTKDGTYYYDGDINPNNIVGQYTKDGSKQKDLQLFGSYRYGMDDINDTPMFVGQKYTKIVNGTARQVFGHFINK